MKAVILAGGLGTRLKPFTETIPKPLLPVGEKAVLEIQIDRLRASGFTEIWIAANYKSDYMRSFLGDGSRYGVKIHISVEDKPLGTAGPLTLIRDHLSEPFLVMNGDILSLVDFKALMRYAREKGAALMLGIKKDVRPFEFGNIHFDGDLVTDIEEKPDITMYILSGIYVMSPGVFEHIPDGQYFGMDHLIKALLADEIPVMKYEIEEYWLDIGRLSDYEEAQEAYRIHFSQEGRD